MFKKVILYTDSDDTCFGEVKSYLEEQEINLDIHNIRTRPLSFTEISNLVRHFDLRHFLNASSILYKKNRFDKFLPGRKEVIELIAKDNDLLARPIIVSGRLTTVGYDRRAIQEMLLDTPRDASKNARSRGESPAGSISN